MAGGTPAHAAIGANVLAALASRLRGSGCRPTTADQRLLVEMTNSYFHPDVQVICGPYALAEDGMSVLNPTLIVEVLSPSTWQRDQSAKWEHYRRIPALQLYVMVDPVARSVLRYLRTAEGWLFTEHTAGAVELPALGVALPVEEVFADLDAIPSGEAAPEGAQGADRSPEGAQGADR